MGELVRVNYDSERPTVSGRDLHNTLEVKTPYHKWLTRMCKYGFSEGVDYVTVDKNVLRADGAVMPQVQHDHQLTMDMAKELCMLQRTEKGKQCRKYFIQFKQSNIWLLYQKHAEKGYTSTKTHSYCGSDGEQHTKVHTYWTQKGRLFIYELLKGNGIVPLIEQEV